MKFVSFHNHNTYSYGDALGTPEVHADRAVSLGMTALGSSNHGNTNDHAAHQRECNRVGIKPIFGCEVYFAPTSEDKKSTRKTHLTVFAMNDIGYRNLNLLITQSYLDFYKWPTVSWESLVKHNEGLAVLSGCADSLISCTLLGGKFLGEPRETFQRADYDRARRRIQKFTDVFEDRYFLEVQRFPHFDRTRTLNPALARLSVDTGVPIIATADVHYPFPEQNKLQALLHAARWTSTPEFAAEASWEHSANLTYPLSDKEIHDDLVATGLEETDAESAIRCTALLAARCNVELPKAAALKYPVPKGQGTSAQYFKRQILAGFDERIKERPDIAERLPEYKARINSEHKVIAGKGFADYFLMAADLVAKAKSRSTDVGPARGSAAASLISYCLGITEIDPIHPLFQRMEFSRFIDPTRSDMPDIDLDFDDEKRKETEADAKALYGDRNVANVANHTGYHGKNTLKDVCRAYKLPLNTFSAIGSRAATRVETDDRRDDSIADVLESYSAHPEIAGLIEAFPTQLRQAVELEGNEYGMGVHACGYVIASDPITDVCPIYTREQGTGRKKTTIQVIPYEKRDAESLGMLKVDFLGSSTMGAIGFMREWSKVDLREMYLMIYKHYDQWAKARKRTAFKGNELDAILAQFRADDVVGIMQFEGGTTRQVCKSVQPDDFDTLAACTALSRPGPYYGGQFKDYVAVRNGEKDWARIHPTGFDRHVEWTYGQIVYQEQIIWILRDLAGFSIKEQLHVRKVIGKKLGEFQFQEIWERFRDGCHSASGTSEEDAHRVFSSIRTAAGYAFNTAHAYSYALIAYWQMWFKVNHPTAFFAATLAKNGDGKDEISRRTAVLQDTLVHGVGVLDWDVNESRANWSPDFRIPGDINGTGVRPGFQQIPGVGEATAQDMVAWRDSIPFEFWPEEGLSWAAMARDNKKGGCVGISVGTLEKIQSFTLKHDPLGINRTRDQLRGFRSQLAAGDFDGTGLPDAVDEYAMSSALPALSAGCAFVGLVNNVVYRDEIERIRGKTGLDIDVIKSQMDDPEKSKKATIFAYDEDGEIALRVSRWQFPRLAAKLELVKADHHIVVVWGKTYEANASSIQVKHLWVLDPD